MLRSFGESRGGVENISFSAVFLVGGMMAEIMEEGMLLSLNVTHNMRSEKKAPRMMERRGEPLPHWRIMVD